MYLPFESASLNYEAYFRLLVESIKDHELIMLDPKGFILTWNAGATLIKGYQAKEIVGQHFSCFFVAEDIRDDRPGWVLRMAATQGRFEEDCWQIRKDGSHFWANVVITALHDQQGRFCGFSQVTRDLSEQQPMLSDRLDEYKQAEKELKHTQNFLNSLIENLPVGVFVRDAETLRYLVWNKAESDIIGYSKAEVLGKNDDDLFPPEEAAFFTAKDQEVLASGMLDTHDEQICTPHRGERTLYTRKIPIFDETGKPRYLLGISEDVTERKQAEAALRKSEERFRNLVETSSDWIWEVNENAVYTYVSPKVTDILGYQPEEVLGKSIFNFMPSEEAERIAENLKELALTCKPFQCFETINVRKDGQLVVLETSGVPIFDAAGVFRGYRGTDRDITQRKQVEITLQTQQQFLQNIIGSDPNWIFVKDWNGKFVLVNQVLAAAYGTSPDGLIGKTDADFNPNQQEVEQYLQSDREVMTTLQEKFIAEESVTNSAGEVFWLQTIKKPLFSPDGTVSQVLVVATDITQRKHMEDALRRSEAQLRQQAQDLEQTLRELQQTQLQLVQSEKMSSLGQLVAGVAHEINNPVSFIYGNLAYAETYCRNLVRLLQLYQRHYPDPVPEIQEEAKAIDLDFLLTDLPKLLTSMEVGADRIQQIVRSLRSFSRMDEAEKKAVDIHEGIDSTLMILQNRLKPGRKHAGIEVTKSYGNLPLVECYAGQLNQVFMNLLTNAIDALEEHVQRSKQSATIEIQTQLLDTGWVRICIADNGAGITEAAQQRLFDPFFTTKPVGKGTGLGLSISYQIVTEKHGGTLQCRSAVGLGTEFIIEIPIEQRHACHKISADPISDSMGKETK